jgi:hypothetical protein
MAVLFAPAMGRQPGGNNRGLCHDCKKLDMSSPCLLPKEGELGQAAGLGRPCQAKTRVQNRAHRLEVEWSGHRSQCSVVVVLSDCLLHASASSGAAADDHNSVATRQHAGVNGAANYTVRQYHTLVWHNRSLATRLASAAALSSIAGGNAENFHRHWFEQACGFQGNAAFPCSAPGRFSSSYRGASAPAQPEPTEGLSQGQQAQGSWLWWPPGMGGMMQCIDHNQAPWQQLDTAVKLIGHGGATAAAVAATATVSAAEPRRSSRA